MPVNGKLFLTPSVLDRAKARVAAGDVRWTTLKDQADQAANWDVRPVDYACAYAVTGNTAYADRAIQLAGVFVSQGVGAVEGDSGFPCRQAIPEVGLTLNWCGDRLSATQRNTWLAALEAQCRWVWPETNPARAGQHGLWVTSNYYWGFFMTLLGGCALLPDRPFGQTLIDQAVARFKTTATPRMQPGGAWEGAYLEEGTSYAYGSLMYMAQSLGAYFSSTGVSPSTLLPASWIPALIRATIHLTMPDLRHLYPGGDQARVSSAPDSDYTISALLPLLAWATPEDAGMARFWIDQVYANRDRVGSVAWEELLFYPDVPAIDYRQRLGTHYSMPGVGAMSIRSDWSANAVQVVAVGGAVRDNDHDDDTGSFFIQCGADVLAGFQKVWSADGGLHKAAALNCILLDGKSQPGKQNGTRVVLSKDEPRATTWVADLAAAYPDLLNSWKRHLLFVKPNWVVILDDIETKSAGTEKKWLLHTKNSPTQTGKTVRAVAGNNCLFSTTLLPADAGVTREQLGTGSWRTNVRSSGTARTFFLHALELAPSSQSQATPVTMAQNGTTVTLSLGSVTVETILDATVPALKLAGSVPPPPSENQSPIAHAGGPYQAVVGKALIFDGSKSKDKDGRIVSYQWQLGDGTAGTGMQFIHSYGKAGSYVVTLTVTDEQNLQNIATAPVTITTTAPPPPPPGPVVIANDGFEDDNPGTSWNYMSLLGTFDPKVTVVEGGGVLTISPRASFNGQHYNGYLGTRRMDFTGTAAQIEVKEITKGNGNTQFALCLDNQNFYLMETEENMLFCTEVTNGQRNQAGGAYNARAQRFWRIRHEAATDQVVWEVSPDGNTWEKRRSLSRKLPLTAVAVQLSAGTWSALKDPGKTVFDNFRMER